MIVTFLLNRNKFKRDYLITFFFIIIISGACPISLSLSLFLCITLQLHYIFLSQRLLFTVRIFFIFTCYCYFLLLHNDNTFFDNLRLLGKTK